jgi:antitoxin ParD1/3/4
MIIDINDLVLIRQENQMASSVNLGPALEEIVDKLVANGRFNSRSEVIREGVRIVHEREARLQGLEAALDLGLADSKAGRLVDLDEGFEMILREVGLQEKVA